MAAIQVTHTFLPPQAEYQTYLNAIWKSGWITTQGQFALQLEEGLREYLGTPRLHAVSSGTTGLQIALHALGVEGEVITGALSFVASASAIRWVGATPVMADVDPANWNLDPAAVEAAITPRTSAILATHLFGNPVDMAAIQGIADRHGLALIYDAAHAFGARIDGRFLLTGGDASVASFNATKLFHTVEGGAVICRNADIADRVNQGRNFGLLGRDHGFEGVGINGKLSEPHAAMGLCLLPRVPELIAHRQALTAAYDAVLSGDERISRQAFGPGVERNFSYYPLLFSSEAVALMVQSALNARDVHPRRYFHPALTALDYALGEAPLAESISKRILCLPLAHDIDAQCVAWIARLVLEALETC